MALKRQQAAEDAIALGIRAMATGESYNYLPQGPILGLPLAMQAQEHSNAERRIRGMYKIETKYFIIKILILLFTQKWKCIGTTRIPKNRQRKNHRCPRILNPKRNHPTLNRKMRKWT